MSIPRSRAPTSPSSTPACQICTHKSILHPGPGRSREANLHDYENKCVTRSSGDWRALRTRILSPGIFQVRRSYKVLRPNGGPPSVRRSTVHTKKAARRKVDRSHEAPSFIPRVRRSLEAPSSTQSLRRPSEAPSSVQRTRLTDGSPSAETADLPAQAASSRTASRAHPPRVGSRGRPSPRGAGSRRRHACPSRRS